MQRLFSPHIFPVPTGALAAPNNETLAPAAAPVVLAKGGAAQVLITISPSSSDALRETAAQLAGFLGRMTGGKFQVVEATAPAGITLGTIAHFPDPALSEPLEIRRHYDGLEAFVLRSDAGTVRLLANTDPGARHAAFRFLQLLGCHWFFAGPAWEIVPAVGSLAGAARLSNAANAVMNELQYAQAASIARNLPTEVWFLRADAGGGTLKFHAVCTGVLNPDGSVQWISNPQLFPQAVAALPTDPDLVLNSFPDGDLGADVVAFYGHLGEPLAAEPDTAIKHSGQQSLRVGPLDPQDGKPFSVGLLHSVPGLAHRFGVWVRAEKETRIAARLTPIRPTAWASPVVRQLVAQDPRLAPLLPQWDEPPKPLIAESPADTGWREIVIDVPTPTAPVEGYTLEIVEVPGSKTIFWIDSIRMQPIWPL